MAHIINDKMVITQNVWHGIGMAFSYDPNAFYLSMKKAFQLMDGLIEIAKIQG